MAVTGIHRKPVVLGPEQPQSGEDPEQEKVSGDLTKKFTRNTTGKVEGGAVGMEAHKDRWGQQPGSARSCPPLPLHPGTAGVQG